MALLSVFIRLISVWLLSRDDYDSTGHYRSLYRWLRVSRRCPGDHDSTGRYRSLYRWLCVGRRCPGDHDSTGHYRSLYRWLRVCRRCPGDYDPTGHNLLCTGGCMWAGVGWMTTIPQVAAVRCTGGCEWANAASLRGDALLGDGRLNGGLVFWLFERTDHVFSRGRSLPPGMAALQSARGGQGCKRSFAVLLFLVRSWGGGGTVRCSFNVDSFFDTFSEGSQPVTYDCFPVRVR